MKDKKQTTNKEENNCKDAVCPFHGSISLRGRIFRGHVIKKFPKRVTIEFTRTIYIKKYERYAKKKTKIHARLPDCLEKEISVGDYVEVQVKISSDDKILGYTVLPITKTFKVI